ncbi:MAG: hypothetical protein RI575_12080 [Balneolaceae bacterium]|nr:hypothetical protein [Balneolaceae bacterium]
MVDGVSWSNLTSWIEGFLLEWNIADHISPKRFEVGNMSTLAGFQPDLKKWALQPRAMPRAVMF